MMHKESLESTLKAKRAALQNPAEAGVPASDDTMVGLSKSVADLEAAVASSGKKEVTVAE